MTYGSLFSGIGGIDLGLDRSGMSCKWQVEINPYCLKILSRHWRGVARFSDVRIFPEYQSEEWSVDVIAGGFPCQDISLVGKRAGITGDRSGLWSEFARLVRDIQPKYVIVENTAGILSSGIGQVLGDLARIGYDAEWETLSAHEFGANHIRPRIFFVAFRRGVLHADRQRREKFNPSAEPVCPRILNWSALPDRIRWPATQSVVVRGIYGIPDRVDRIRGLGNAVVPAISQWIGERIIKFDRGEI